MATRTTPRSLSMKLLIDNKTNRVLFAEARKDVIDFLFDLLTIPVGSVVELLTKESMVGSIGNLYKSVELLLDVDDDIVRRSLLNQTAAAKITHLLTASRSTTSAATKYYRCSDSYSCEGSFTNVRGIDCPSCDINQMTTPISYLGPNSESVADALASALSSGFVRRGVTYSVMDDLTVTPMSTISTVRMLNKFHVTDVGSLEERIVNLGMKEGLGLLKASLQSKTVLTDVFIGEKLGQESTSSLIKA